MCAAAHAGAMLLGHPDMTAGEAFSSFICSHLMTPALNAALALLQVHPAEHCSARALWPRQHVLSCWKRSRPPRHRRTQALRLRRACMRTLHVLQGSVRP